MLNLREEYLAELREIFTNYCPHAEIWAYGGRVKNDCHAGSDLDLTIKSFNEEGKSLAELKQLLNDSNIPILIDINEYAALPQNFREEIDRLHERIF